VLYSKDISKISTKKKILLQEQLQYFPKITKKLDPEKGTTNP
jgi:hypothetical protein